MSFTRSLGLLSLVLVIASPGKAQKRPVKDIQLELAALSREIRRYEFASQIAPQFQHQMPGELGDQYRQHLALLDELAAASPAEKIAGRPIRARDLAVLAVFKDADAIAKITELSQSKVPADAVVGKLAAIQFAWWTTQKPDAQAKVMEDIKALAKANPTDDALPSAFLDIANAGASSETLAESLRVLIETELKGPSALKYKARPDKLGRPLVVAGVTVQGKPFSTDSLKGKVIIIDFWATWCGPCRDALPELIEFYQANKDKGLEIVGVSCDSRKPELQAFLKENPAMTWPNLFGPGSNGWHALAAKYQVSSVPTMYIIDRDGILRRIDNGRFAKSEIEKMLEKPAASAVKK